jgi:hypothetical protein
MARLTLKERIFGLIGSPEVSNAIQGEPWKRQKQLTRAFERISEPDLSEKTSKLWTQFAVKLKKRTSGSLRSTERVAAMRLPCRNFGLRYLRAL